MNYRIWKAIQIIRKEGLVELIFRAFRFLYRSIPATLRINFQETCYFLTGYRAARNLLRVYSVPVEDINYEISKEDFEWRLLDFRIRDGDWDLGKKHINENAKYEMFRQHFQHGREWRETERYQKVVNKLKNNQKINELDAPKQNISKYEEYLSYLDNLYKNIDTEGYKSQEELSASSDFTKRRIHPSLNEIQVFIGRNGEIICKSGLHRLYIAKLAGIEKVPVRTQVRHKKWQKIREQIRSAESFYELDESVKENLGHPELKDIVPEE